MSWTYESILAGRKIKHRPQLIALAMRKAMRQRRLSILKLAQRSGVGLRSIQLVLDGQGSNTTFVTMARMAEALELDLHYLAGLAPASQSHRAGEYVIHE